MNVMAAGLKRFFTISTLSAQSAGVGEVFGSFKNGRYGNTVKVMFLRGLFQTLWTLLLVVPGIIKHYEYYMVPYLVAEYPEKDSKEIFRLSREMMNGINLRPSCWSFLLSDGRFWRSSAAALVFFS